MVEVTCQQCKKSFEVIKSRVGKAKFCSRKCSSKAQAERYAEERMTKTCPACGKEFSFPRCHESRRRYCSTACSDPNKEYCGPRGDTHHLWKGGITRHANGYVYEMTDWHPFPSLNKYIFQHRLVVERSMRRENPDHHFLVEIDGEKYLRPEIEVHHLNGVRDDNDPENLVACTPAAHHAFHHGLKVAEDEYWPHRVKPNKQHSTRIKKICLKCHTEFEVAAHRRSTARYCSKACFDSRAKI